MLLTTHPICLFHYIYTAQLNHFMLIKFILCSSKAHLNYFMFTKSIYALCSRIYICSYFLLYCSPNFIYPHHTSYLATPVIFYTYRSSDRFDFVISPSHSPVFQKFMRLHIFAPFCASYRSILCLIQKPIIQTILYCSYHYVSGRSVQYTRPKG